MSNDLSEWNDPHNWERFKSLFEGCQGFIFKGGTPQVRYVHYSEGDDSVPANVVKALTQSSTRQDMAKPAHNNILQTPEFPLHRLPKRLQAYIDECKLAFNYHHDFISVSSLFSFAFAVRGNVQLAVNDAWMEKPTVFCCIVAPSGTGKTHPLEYALRPISDIDRGNLQKYRRDKQQYDSLSRGAKEQGSKPVLREILLNDATLEGLAKTHAVNPSGIVVHRDEFASQLQDFNKYRKGSDESQWLSIWSGRDIKVTRRTQDEPLIITSPCVSVIGGMQPSQLKLFSMNDRDTTGFIDRVLFCYPDIAFAPYPSEIEADDGILDTYRAAVSSAYELTDGRNVQIRLTPDAATIFTKYGRDIADRINSTEEDYEKSMLAKACNHTLRISIALQVARWSYHEVADLDVLNAETLQNAIEVGDYFLQHGDKVRRALRGAGSGYLVDRKTLVLELKASGMSKMEIHRMTNISRTAIDRYLRQNVSM